MKEQWRKIVLIVFVIAVSIFLFSNRVKTVSENIIITEICPSGCTATDHQWVEIFNKSSQPVDLSGWKFWEGSVNHGITISPSSTVTSSILISGAYAIIVQNDRLFFLDHPSTTALVFDSAWTTLTKTGEEIGIKKGSGTDDFVEKFVYAGVNNYSLERIDDHNDPASALSWKEHPSSTSAGIQNYWWIVTTTEAHINHAPTAHIESANSVHVGESVFFDGSQSSDLESSIGEYVWMVEGTSYEGISLTYAFATTGTKQVLLTVHDSEQASSTVIQYIEVLPSEISEEEEDEEIFTTTSKIVINEFLSDPESPLKEWIELYNVSEEDVVVDGFTLYDAVGKIATVTGTIPTSGFRIIYLSSSKLNQSGDSISLKNTAQEIIDSVVYGVEDDNAPIPGKAHSTARVSDGEDTDNDHSDFAYTVTPTPGSPNNITPKEAVYLPHVDTTNNSDDVSPTQAPKPTFAEGGIVINEFVSIPADKEVEFVELLNTTNSSISLEGWIFQDGSLAKTTLNGMIAAHQFFVIEKPKGSLNNSGDLLTLIDPSGKEIDRVVYGEWNDEDVSAAAPPKGTSLMRLLGKDSGNYAEDFVITETITRGHENIFYKKEKVTLSTSTMMIVSSTVGEVGFGITEEMYSSDFIPVIVEVMPNPLGSDTKNEYIELFNPYDQDIYLFGLFLDDGEGGSKPYAFPEETVLKPGEYRAFYSKDTKLPLTNSGENVRIVDSEGLVLYEIEYVSAKEGKSYTYGNGLWFWTAEITPDEPNPSTPTTDTMTTSKSKTKIITTKPVVETTLNDVRNFDVGTMVSLVGTVVAEPGVMSSQYFYVAGSPGLQIYSYKKDFPPLARGDRVRIKGELAETSGEMRIKIVSADDVQMIGTIDEYQPRDVAIADIDEPYEGWLVQISGEVTGIKGSYVYVDDGTDEIRLYIRGGSGIDKSLFKEGIHVSIAGIVQETKSGYMISPRDIQDVRAEGEVAGQKIVAPVEMHVESRKQIFYSIVLVLFGLVIIVGVKLYGGKLKVFFKKEKDIEY